MRKGGGRGKGMWEEEGGVGGGMGRTDLKKCWNLYWIHIHSRGMGGGQKKKGIPDPRIPTFCTSRQGGGRFIQNSVLSFTGHSGQCNMTSSELPN